MSKPVNSNYLVSNTNRIHEIQWLKNKIVSLQPKYEKRPSTLKEIRDLERQIVDRGGIIDTHSWIKMVDNKPKL